MEKGDAREDRQEPEREVFTDFTGGAPGSVTKPAEEIQPVFMQHGNFISGTCKTPEPKLRGQDTCLKTLITARRRTGRTEPA